MIKSSLIAIASVCMLFSCNQFQPGSFSKQQFILYSSLYQEHETERYHTAIMAVQMVLLTDSTNSLRDSLPELFGVVNNVQACLATTKKALGVIPRKRNSKT